MLQYQGGSPLSHAGQEARLRAALEDWRRLEGLVLTAPADDLINAAALLDLKVKKNECGKAGKPSRVIVLQRLSEQQRKLRRTLQAAGLEVGESTDEEADEDISASEVDEKKAGLTSSPEDNDEIEHPPPSATRSTARRTSSMASPSPIKLARPQRTASATKRAILQQSASALPDDEAQDVLNYIQLPAARVTRRMLAGLSERGQRLYEQLRQAEQRPTAHGRTFPVLPTPAQQAPQVSFSIGPGGPAHVTTQSPLSVAQPPAVWLPNARLSGGAPHRFQPAGQGASDDEDGAPQAYEDEEKEQQFVPSRRLRGVLQRLGMPDGSLCELDALEVARAEVGGGSFEQWWQARAPSMRREGKGNQYYEGLVLSLILDNLDRPDVLAQIAARRWCVLNSTVTHNLSWDMAKALLPMSSAGAISTSMVYDMQKFAKAQKEMRAAMYNTAERGSSGSYNSTGGAGGRRKSKNEREADKKSGSGRENEAQSGSRKGRKNRSRNNSGGAGASSASGAEQE